MACSSCSGKDTIENPKQVLSMSLDEQTRIMHEKINSLDNEIAEMRDTVYSINDSVKEVNKKIAESSMGKIVITVLFVVVALLIIVVAVAICYYKKLNRKIRELIEEINAMKEVRDNKKSQPTYRSINQESPEIREIKKRIVVLEKQLCQSPKETAKVPKKTENGKKEEKEDIKDGYFEDPIGPSNGIYYFIELHNSSSDKTSFKVKIKNDWGEFEPNDLSCIKSYNYTSEVLMNCDSKVIVADSTGFDVLEKGKVRKDGNRWIIVKPVKVRFK